MQLDRLVVFVEPSLTCSIEVVIGSVVDDQKNLPPGVMLDQQLEEIQEGRPVEYGSERVSKAGIVQTDGSVDVGGFSFPSGGNTGLLATWSPRSMKRGVELEARFIFKENYTANASGFFLMAGNLLFNQ